MENTSGNPSENRSESNVLLQNVIDGMQLRKQSMLSPLQTKILEFEKQKDVLSIQIGHAVYSAHKKSNAEQDSIQTAFLSSLFSQMGELDSKIDGINSEMAEIEACYEEEVNLLAESLGSAPLQPTPGGATGVAMFCSECGAKYVQGDSSFCENCGARLE